MHKTNHIAVDVDEVLFPFVQTFVDEHNAMYGSTLTVDDFITYEFEQVTGLSVEETIRRVHEVHEKGYDFQQPLSGAQHALDKLAGKVDISVITARNPRFERETRAWLDRHFGGIIKDVVLIGHPKDVGYTVVKADVCRQIGADVLIDDSVGHIEACLARGVQGILFGDYPWNRDVTVTPEIVVCKNWYEVLDYFEHHDSV